MKRHRRFEAEGQTSLPADDKSMVTLKLTARDRGGNLVPDGTVVIWEKGDDTDGGFEAPQEATKVASPGSSTGSGSRGSESDPRHVDEAILEIEIVQAPVILALTAPRTSSTTTVHRSSSRSRRPHRRTRSRRRRRSAWFRDNRRMEQTQPLTGARQGPLALRRDLESRG